MMTLTNDAKYDNRRLWEPVTKKDGTYLHWEDSELCYTKGKTKPEDVKQLFGAFLSHQEHTDMKSFIQFCTKIKVHPVAVDDFVTVASQSQRLYQLRCYKLNRQDNVGLVRAVKRICFYVLVVLNILWGIENIREQKKFID